MYIFLAASSGKKDILPVCMASPCPASVFKHLWKCQPLVELPFQPLEESYQSRKKLLLSLPFSSVVVLWQIITGKQAL